MDDWTSYTGTGDAAVKYPRLGIGMIDSPYDFDLSPEDRKRLREIWRSCYKRCENPKCKDAKRYMAKGIRMCKPWRDDFWVFARWAMTHGYRPDLTLDRVNNNKGYDPGNCRWVSRRVQAHNRGTNKRLRNSKGEVHDIEAWSKIVGIAPSTILRRINLGWTVDEALYKPVSPRRSKNE